jgi:hypothetical protein
MVTIQKKRKPPKQKKNELRKSIRARYQWLTPVILAAQEAEIRKIVVQSQPGQRVQETLSQKKKPFTKKGWWSGSRCRP